MTLAPGTELGHYEIVSPLGAGGMGEVYRARDPRLGREVAIKVLSSERTGSAADEHRFQQEARAVALLSHPNILAIHEFDIDRGVSFAVTELLNGETLAQRIQRGPVPWTEAVTIAAAICDGLAAAHAKGIVHRDLKPSNIFLTSDGHVKILDFGLARMSATSNDTTTDLRTEPGTVMGTIGYMSPEQLRGESVDASTDVFALGCIVFETITGTSPFARPTAPETNAAILRDEPAALPADEAPAALERVIRRCLAKNPSERYHSAHDLALEFRSLGAPARPTRPTWPFVAAALAIVFALALAIVFVRRPPSAPRNEIRSILVVPFENATRDANAEYLSDGIAEGLINSLAELPDVRVVARTTAFTFKGKPLDLPEIRRQLHVDAVLSGRVVSAANNLVVQADLVDTAAGTELWGNRFHEETANVVAIEQEIVGRISDALRVKLTNEQQTRIAHPATRSGEAYNLYLQGRFFWNKRNAESISKARTLFEEATKIDPSFALAYSGLADAYNMLGQTYRAMPYNEAHRRAVDAAETALRLDPNLAEAHASMALIESNRFHWPRAESEFKRAIEINPNYANALLWYSLYLSARGRLAESLQLMEKAEQVDPLSALMSANVAQRLNVVGRHQDALVHAEKAIELDPDYAQSYVQAAVSLEALGQRSDAAAMCARAAEHAGPPGLKESMLVRRDMLLNERAEAEARAERLEQRAVRGETGAVFPGWAYCATGNHDKAIAWLTRALEQREPPFRDGARDGRVRELLGDPRYTEILKRLDRGFDD